ncbi:MAG: aminoglycoside phosphotransferase family protein [Dehalococcoidia bacterium]|nr:aminoglycoside phosphotransferase family protein [Dehalococcoidia bacterium]
MLSAAREPWLAIDPKGIVGDPHLEPAMLLLNPRERVRATPDLEALFARRLDIVAAETGLDPGRVAGWAFAKAVLGLTWDVAVKPRAEVDEWLRQARALRTASACFPAPFTVVLTSAAGFTPAFERPRVP